MEETIIFRADDLRDAAANGLNPTQCLRAASWAIKTASEIGASEQVQSDYFQAVARQFGNTGTLT